MAGKQHLYAVHVTWTGNLGSGTSSYRDYSRDHEIRVANKPDQVLPGSADRAFRGDPRRYNPEELMVAALSQCHLLAYLHACAASGVVVTSYSDDATATMVTEADGSGRFVEATLNPRVMISAGSDPVAAEQAHDVAQRTCFIANSVNFPVHHKPTVMVSD